MSYAKICLLLLLSFYSRWRTENYGLTRVQLSHSYKDSSPDLVSFKSKPNHLLSNAQLVGRVTLQNAAMYLP